MRGVVREAAGEEAAGGEAARGEADVGEERLQGKGDGDGVQIEVPTAERWAVRCRGQGEGWCVAKGRALLCHARTWTHSGG